MGGFEGLNGGKNKFLDEAVHADMDGHLTVGTGFGGQVDDLAGELVPDVLLGVDAFHFVEENIAHLVVAAQIFDFVYQLIFCHREVPPFDKCNYTIRKNISKWQN